jgi:hypothetical protein
VLGTLLPARGRTSSGRDFGSAGRGEGRGTDGFERRFSMGIASGYSF